MLAATRVLNPGPVRIGSLGKNVTLPRTVQLNVIIAGAICAVPGLMVGAIVSQFVGGVTTMIVLATIGAFAGYLLVTWSPFQKESLLRYFMVSARNRGHRIETDCEGQGSEGLDRSDTHAICPSCFQEVEVKPDGTCPPHQIRRRFYVGICQLPYVMTGEVQIRSAAVDLAPPPVSPPMQSLRTPPPGAA